MENVVCIRSWLEELKNELNEALQKYVGKVTSPELRHEMYITVENIVDKYRSKGYCDNNFNVYRYLYLNIKKGINNIEEDNLKIK